MEKYSIDKQKVFLDFLNSDLMHFFKENSQEKNKKYEDFIDDGTLNYNDGEYEIVFYWCLKPLAFSGRIKTFGLVDFFQLKGKIDSEDIRFWPVDYSTWQPTFPLGIFSTILKIFNTIKEEATTPIGNFLNNSATYFWPSNVFDICYDGCKRYEDEIIINYARKGIMGTAYIFDFNFRKGVLTFIKTEENKMFTCLLSPKDSLTKARALIFEPWKS